MAAVDTSVAVPALLGWHERHEVCRRAAAGARVPAHVVLEVFSVLTRLPPPHRVDADVAHEAVRQWFPPTSVLTLDVEAQRASLDFLHAAGVEGGSVYDGVVALTVAAHDERLLTRDRRAIRTYEALGIDFELIGS